MRPALCRTSLAGTAYAIVPLEMQKAIISVCLFLGNTSNKKLALKLPHYILSKPKAFDMLVQRGNFKNLYFFNSYR